MVSKIFTAALQGMEAARVVVEADACDGLPMMTMVGDLAGEVREAQDRVRSALRNLGIAIPPKRITVSLSPADLHKEGALFDLPIAMALLRAFEEIPEDVLARTLFLGELGLEGRLKKVNGVLPIVCALRSFGCDTCVVPFENLAEAAVAADVRVYGAKNLADVIAFAKGEGDLPGREAAQAPSGPAEEGTDDFCDLRGQNILRRSCEVAAAGLHNLLIIGPPGSGKTMAARRIPSILPAMTREEAMEVTKIRSITGLLPPGSGLIRVRPFRAPHHTITPAALSGGGKKALPGEVTLAHRGVLFLDELAEFKKDTLDLLRQPLEDGSITISRVNATATYPARFMMVAAMNPCKCGYYPDRRRCSCAPIEVHRYLSHVSVPFLDRFDLCVEAPELEYSLLTQKSDSESSSAIRARVAACARRQEQRYQATPYTHNAELGSRAIQEYCGLDQQGEALLRAAYERLRLTARSYARILKVARTIADLDGEDVIRPVHLSEAISYRMIDVRRWGNLPGNL